jgi:hypothetical protein
VPQEEEIVDKKFEETYLSSLENPTVKELSMACVVLMAKYDIKDPMNLLLVGDPSTGKSTLAYAFHDDELADFYDRVTENALLPGRSSKDDDSRQGILAESHGKALIIDEASTLFSGNRDVVSKMIAIIIDSSGKRDLTIGDAGGKQHIKNTRVRYIFGMTKRVYWRNIKYMNEIGPRFGTLLFHTDRSKRNLGDGYPVERSRVLINSIKTVIKKVKQFPLPSIAPADVIDEAYKFANMLSVARSFKGMRSPRDGEGNDRSAKQLINMAFAVSMLFHREPTVEDVKRFEPLFYYTIPYRNQLRWTVKDIDNLDEEAKAKVEKDVDRLIECGIDVGDLDWHSFVESATSDVDNLETEMQENDD